jgi:hypothetical protein
MHVYNECLLIVNLFICLLDDITNVIIIDIIVQITCHFIGFYYNMNIKIKVLRPLAFWIFKKINLLNDKL